MERFAFIHGSSVGQSAFIPSDSRTGICNDIANKYFQGRTLRQKESAAKLSLFVDLYKSPQGDCYSVYSFVNNNCRGANGREGQYLALTIICKNVYIYPESIYRMLSSAYNQMFATGKIIGSNKEGEEQYTISQFSDENEYLSIFLKKIEDAFDNITNGLGKALDSNSHIADYDSWHGTKVNIDFCNSMAAFKRFCDVGRLYISEEYESYEEKIKVLEKYINKLETEKVELEHRGAEVKRFEKSKARDEIEELNSQIKRKDIEIDSLTAENKSYKTTIEKVRGELEKYARLGKSITDIQRKGSQYQSKSKKDIVKICLLLVILILTILSSLMNYAFFRDIPPFYKESKEMSEKTETMQNYPTGTSNNKTTVAASTSIEIAPTSIESEANGGSYKISITTDGEWSTPISPKDWVAIKKDDDNQLSIDVESNASQDPRECTFMIRAGSLEKQIRITQKGKSVENPRYGVVVRDKTGKVLQQGATVQKGQKLSVTVTDPSMRSEGFGWKYYNCFGSSRSNVKDVTVTVDGTKEGASVIISYGDTSSTGYREKVFLKLKVTSADNADTHVEASSNTDNASTDETGTSN